MTKGKSTWKYNKLLTARRNYFDNGGGKKDVSGLYAPTPSIVSPNTLTPSNSMTDTHAFLAGMGSVPTPKSNNIFSSIGKMTGSLGGGLLNGIGNAVGSIGYKAISGGLSSGAGKAINAIGSAVGNVAGMIPGVGKLAGPIISAAAGIIGGGVNALVGSKLNEENIAAAKADAARMNNAKSDADNFDALAGLMSTTVGRTIHDKSYYGKDGAFSNKAQGVYEENEKLAEIAEGRQDLSFINNAEYLSNDQYNLLASNYKALGGPLGYTGGAIDYDFMNRYLRNKELGSIGQNNNINPLLSSFAKGGFLGAHGADFTNGVTQINNGGSHENNPFQGVPIGVDPEGIPNLVEEGETIFNDYVFSRRIFVPKAIRDKYKLRGIKSITFADACKQLSKESEERPNDPISLRGLRAIMSDLANAQEEVKAKKQMRVAANMAANGGKVNKFDGTTDSQMINYDWTKFLPALSDYTASRIAGNTAGKYRPDSGIPTENNPYMLGASDIAALEASDAYKAFTESMIASPNMDYLRALDAGVANGVPKLFENGQLRENWADLFRHRRTDGIGGIYHWTPTITSSPVTLETLAGAIVDPTASNNPATSEELFRYYYNTSTLDNPNYVEYTDENAPLWMRNNKYYLTSSAKQGNTTSYFYDPRTEEEPGEYQDWLRYAPAVGYGISTITDSLGLTNKPDYSSADALLDATSKSGAYRPVEFSPVGNYLRYTPFDREFAINQLNAQSGATRRAIMQNAGMNRGAGMAALLSADYNSQNQIGNLLRQAEEYNLAQKQKIEEFNRGTNMTNSQGFLQSGISNQKAWADQRDFSMKGLMAAVQMRETERAKADTNRSNNISGLFQALGDIGYEEANRRQANWIRRKFGIPGTEDYPMASNGGKLRKKKRGLTV